MQFIADKYTFSAKAIVNAMMMRGTAVRPVWMAISALPAPEEWITDIPGGKPAVTPPPFTMPTDDDWLTELKSGG